MGCNLGNTERAIRVVLGTVLVTVGYVADVPQWAALTAYLLGVAALVTGIMGFCPAWKMFGINTCGTKPA